MSEIVCSEEAVWTKANLQRLLAALKATIPEKEILNPYQRGLKSVDWNEVAFPPFSPEECKKKWREMLQKMRKTRTLTDLIVEAESTIDSPFLKRNLHPELPKRPVPPPALFYEENLTMFHAEHPNMGTQESFKVLIKMYFALSDEKKAKYIEKYQLASSEYKIKMQQFREQYCTLPKCRQCPQRRQLPDGEQPDEVAEGLPSKPPRTGYIIFCKEQKPSLRGSKTKPIAVWTQWRDLTEAQRDEYNMRCKDLKRQYSIELDEYLMTFDEEEQQRILDKYGLKRPKGVKKFPGEPKMPSQTANALFFKDKMELLKDEFPNTRDRCAEVSQLWLDLPNKEKECYRKKIRRNIATYTVELHRWFKTLAANKQEAYLRLKPYKYKYLVDELEADDQKQQRVHITSDSEDEDLEYSSSDEEEEVLETEEYEEEEDEDALMFDMF